MLKLVLELRDKLINALKMVNVPDTRIDFITFLHGP